MIKFKASKLLESDGRIDFDLTSFIPETHLCRIIEALVSQLDISEIIASYSPIGQRGISPRMLLSILFYGYSEGMRSGEALSERCKRDLHYIYLSGGLQPSKTTINDFRRNHHKHFKSLFEQQIKLLKDLGHLNTAEGHGDGTIIRANASSKRAKTKEQYEKWLKILEEDIRSIKQELIAMEQIKQSNLEQSLASSTKISKLSKKSELESLNKKIDQIKDVMTRFESCSEPGSETSKSSKTSKSTKSKTSKKAPKINLTDSDAPFMIPIVIGSKKGHKAPHYNVQVMVEANQFIVHAHSNTAHNDIKELEPALEGYNSNTGKYPDKSNFDAGYSSFNNLEYLEQNQIQTFIPNKDENKDFSDQRFHISHFEYVSEQDIYICPQGNTLYFHRLDKSGDRIRKRYQPTGNECLDCPFKDKCTKAQKRTLSRDVAQELKEQMKQKLDIHRSFYNKRRFMIEPVPIAIGIGHWRHNLGFNQFSLRGIDKVNAELLILVISWNFMKLANRMNKTNGLKSFIVARIRCYTGILKTFNRLKLCFPNFSKNFFIKYGL